MNNNEAIKLLDETFSTEFNSSKFSSFLSELFNGFYPSPRSIGTHKEYEQHIVSITKLGNYKQNGSSMEILVVKLRKGTSLDRARTMQRNVIAKLLKNFNIDSALVAFTSEDSFDWRFSFVKMDYKLTEDGKVSEELTPAKRYSFLVGPNEPNHTCRSQFIELIKTETQKPSIDEIENAFSIEKVTKEFFEKYKNLYQNLKKDLDNLVKKDKNLQEEFEDKQISTVDFAKKLLGQIVFLYFLQKKGWLGVKKGETGKFEQWGKGSKRFIQELFYKAKEGKKNFFNNYLEPLFYQALSTDRRADNDYYEKFNCKIPFLNGGLFEPLNGYNWGETDINLDNSLFEEIFKTFDEFNFTIKEDEPLEKEVAVDPEMLGKVFENLLDVEDRKSKGAFYTPREIVHYMCQQSLINYLETNTKILREDLEFFIQKGDLALEYLRRQEIGRLKSAEKEFVLPKTISHNAKELETLLIEIKICDPAVGSGAFPVGMMNEIIKARTILSYLLKKPKTDYELKRETIENSLYGVDVEPSAVEITKLRFWLSLIVDEEDMNNIKPLPNLENKIMCGNSLIEEFEGIKLYIDPQEIKEKKDRQATLDQTIDKKIKKSEQKLKELRQKQKEFFDVENRTHKNRLKVEIDKIEWEFIEETLREQGDGENMKKLEQYMKNKSKPFFLWKLYFSDVFHRENPGFDVVIANPPYFNLQTIKDSDFKDALKRKFDQIYTGQNDILYFFYKLGYDLLRDDGSLSFITSRYFLEADFAIKLRNFLTANTCIKNLIDFGSKIRIFGEASVNASILIFTKTKKSNENINAVKFKSWNKPNSEIIDFVMSEQKSDLVKEAEKVILKQENLQGKKWLIASEMDSELMAKLNSGSEKLISICNIFKSIESGLDRIKKEDQLLDIFRVTQKTINEKKLEKVLLVPLIKNGMIRKYRLNYTNEFLIFITTNLDLIKYPNIKKHLQEFKQDLEDRYDIKKSNAPWYRLSNLRNLKLITSKRDKLFVPMVAPENRFIFINKDDYICTADVYVVMAKSKSFELKYIQAILNSTLMNHYVKLNSKAMDGEARTSTGKKSRRYSYSVKNLSDIPIKKTSKPKQKQLIEIVDKILSITKDEDYPKNPEKQAKVRAYERQIDRLVYGLYRLTPKEIKIVEGEK